MNICNAYYASYWISICKSRDTSDTSAKNQGMNIMGALVRVHRLQVHDVPDHMVLVANPVPSQHVPALTCDRQGLAAVVPLQQGDHLRHHLALLLETAKLEAGVEAEGDFRHCVRQLLLDQLVCCQRPSELVPAHRVIPRLVDTELCSSKGTPRNSIAGVIQARERTLEADHVGQHVLLGDGHLVHEDHPSVGGAEGELAFNLGGREAGHALLQNEAPEATLSLCPHNEDISNG